MVIVNANSPAAPLPARDRGVADQNETRGAATNQGQSIERPVGQVNAPETLPDEQRMDLSQAREVLAREGGQRTPENPITSSEEAAGVADAVRNAFSSDSARGMAAQTANLPRDVASLLSVA